MNTFPSIHSAQYAYLPTEDLYLLLAMFLTVAAIYGIVYLALKIASKTFLAANATPDTCPCDNWRCNKKH